MRSIVSESVLRVLAALPLALIGCGSGEAPQPPLVERTPFEAVLPSGARLVELPGRGLVGAVAETELGWRTAILFEPAGRSILATLDQVGPAEFRFAVAQAGGAEPARGTLDVRLDGDEDERFVRLLFDVWAGHDGSPSGVSPTAFDGLSVFDFPFDGLAGGGRGPLLDR